MCRTGGADLRWGACLRSGEKKQVESEVEDNRKERNGIKFLIRKRMILKNRDITFR